MFHITTNKTEASWSRSDIRKAQPGADSNEILERITKATPSEMSYEAAIDFFKLQLGTWRRFYKEDDNVDITEGFTADNKRVTQIKSLNIVFYVCDLNGRDIKIKSGFYDTIQSYYKKIFEDQARAIDEEMAKNSSSDSPLEMLHGAQ